MAVRLVAVDRDGKEHPGVGEGGGVIVFTQLMTEFDASPEQYREYPGSRNGSVYERVEVPGIALNPAGGR